MKASGIAFPVALAAVLLVTQGCDDDPAAPAGPDPEEMVADFSLADVNPTSTRFGEDVSPRDYLARISAWYFGVAT